MVRLCSFNETLSSCLVSGRKTAENQTWALSSRKAEAGVAALRVRRPARRRRRRATWQKGLEMRVSRSEKLKAARGRSTQKTEETDERETGPARPARLRSDDGIPSKSPQRAPSSPLPRPALVPLCDNSLTLCRLLDLEQTLTNRQPLSTFRLCKWRLPLRRPSCQAPGNFTLALHGELVHAGNNVPQKWQLA